MSTEATPANVGSNDQLGLVPERAAFEEWRTRYINQLAGHPPDAWEAWQARAALQRDTRGLESLVERLLMYSDIRRNDPRESREALRDLIVGELADVLQAALMAERDALRA